MNYLRAFAEPITESSGPIRFVASTEGVKRDGMNLRANDWDLTRYRANPIVLWAHDARGSRPPIGRADVSIEGNRLMADVTFDPDDEFAQMIERKYRNGFLGGVSVNWDNPRGSQKNELIEISAVPIPLDPATLVQRSARGLQEINDHLLSFLDDEESQPTTDAEALWVGTAYQMVRLFRRDADDAESVRLPIYKRLSRSYERLGKVPPEFLGVAELAALEPDTWRGLFLEGEAEAIPELFVTIPADDADDWWSQPR